MMSQTCDYITSLLKKSYTYNRYEKVASFLLEQVKEDNQDKGIIHDTIPYSHEEVASIIGLSRVTTTKVLNEFEKKGYIHSHYRKISILDQEALRKIIKKIE